MKSKKSGVTVLPSGIGYIIVVTDRLIWPNRLDLPVTQTELEEIVKQSLPYLRVPKGTKVVELKK